MVDWMHRKKRQDCGGNHGVERGRCWCIFEVVTGRVSGLTFDIGGQLAQLNIVCGFERENMDI